MTSDDEWTKTRAWEVARDLAVCSIHSLRVDMLIAFGQEAISRTRAEERALAEEALKNAVAAEQERTENWRIQCQNEFALANQQKARADALEAKLARLRNPDEAMVTSLWLTWKVIGKSRRSASAAIRAIAAHFDEKEKAGD